MHFPIRSFILYHIVLVTAWLALSPPAQAQCLCPCPADMTNNTLRDGRDIAEFVDCLLSGPAQGAGCACADLNTDSLVDMLDVPLFVGTLLAPNPCSLSMALYEPGPQDAPPASPCREGNSCGSRPDTGVANSIYFFNGEFYQSAVDLHIRGRGMDLIWARKYRSKNGPSTALGHGWDFSYNIFIEAAGADRLLHDGNTRGDLYALQPDGHWARDELFRELSLNRDGTYTLTFADTGRWNFRSLTDPVAPGRIDSIVDRNGNTIGFAYDAQSRLVTITDTLSRNVTIGYDASNHITSVTDFTGRQVVYAYDANGDLSSVRSPVVTGTPNGNDFLAGKTTSYTYSSGFADARLNHNLLTITDPKGQISVQNTCSTTTDPADLLFDRIVRQAWGNPTEVIDVVYVPQSGCSGNNFAALKAIVNDRVGNVKEYFYDAGNRLVMSREYTGRAVANQPTTESANRPTGKLRPTDPDYFETRWTYNADAMTAQITHPNLNTTVKTYELDLDPLAPRRSRGNLRQVTNNPGPLGGDQASITQSYTYETGFGGCGCGTNFVKTHTDGRGNTTTHTYDTAGNRVHTDYPAGGGVEDWTYNAFGQMTNRTLPANGSSHRRLDTYSYYAAGPQAGYLQSEILDSGGLNITTQYEYDALGNVVRRIHPDGADTLYTYNQLNQRVRELSREVTAGGGIRYEKLTWYDANDNVVRTDIDNRDESGTIQPNSHFSMIREHGILDEVTRICQERGAVSLTNTQLTCADMPATERMTTEYAYDANRNQILERRPQALAAADRDPLNTIDTVYDERDLVFRVIRAQTSPGQSTNQTDYDGNRNLKSSSQGLESSPRVSSFVHDGYNRRTTATDPMGNVTTHHYDANGNMISQRIDGEVVDVAGSAANIRLSERTYQYDAMDRRIRQDIAHFDTQPPQTPIGDGFSTTQWVYADNSQVTGSNDDNPGHVTTYAYDTMNRRVAVTDAKNNTATYNYDADSRITLKIELDKSDLGTTDETFNTTYAYDGLDRLIQTTDNIGNMLQYLYDSRGNIVRSIDGRGIQTRYEYDGVSRLVQTIHDMNGNGLFIDPEDVVISQSWDDSSRLRSQTDDNGNMTQYSYDSIDRRITTDFADCTTDSMTYDVHGNAIQRIDANNSTANSTYDLLNRKTNKTISVGPGVSSDTTFEAYQYDGLSRLVQAQDNDSVVRRRSGSASGYDSLSNILRETQQNLPAGTTLTVSAEYDGESNLTRLAYPGGRAIVCTYDGLDRTTEVRDDPPGPGSTIATTLYVGPYRVEQRDYGPMLSRYQPSYDGLRRLQRNLYTTQPPSGSAIEDATYSWDADHNKILAVNSLSGTPPDTRQYSYDALNRLVTSQRVSPPPADTAVIYTMDGLGNRLNVSGGSYPGNYTMDPTLCEPGDLQMNQYTTTPFNTSRLYDQKGNLTDINSGARTYTYDYRNRLVRVYTPSTGQTVTYRYDCLGRRIERNVTGTITRFVYFGPEEIEERNASSTVVATYVWGNGSDKLLSMTRGGQKYYYHADDVGNTLAVTDSTGAVADRVIYDDYGTTTVYQPGIYGQPTEGNYGYLSDLDPTPDGTWVAADDFTLTQTATVTSLRWFGFYGNGVAADTFLILIFQDAGGVPGSSPIYQMYPSSVTRTQVSGSSLYQYNLTLSPTFSASAGIRYWLSIVNNLPGSSYWAWMAGGPGNNQLAGSGSLYGPWTPSQDDLAFALNPKPASGNPYLFHCFHFDSDLSWYWCGDRFYTTASSRYLSRATGDEIPTEIVPLNLVSVSPNRLGESRTNFAGNNPVSAITADLGNPRTFAGSNPTTMMAGMVGDGAGNVLASFWGGIGEFLKRLLPGRGNSPYTQPAVETAIVLAGMKDFPEHPNLRDPTLVPQSRCFCRFQCTDRSGGYDVSRSIPLECCGTLWQDNWCWGECHKDTNVEEKKKSWEAAGFINCRLVSARCESDPSCGKK